MPARSTSTNIDESACLSVRAGGVLLTLHHDVLDDYDVVGPRVAVPGSVPWCLGVVSWRGRLLTLLDAGRLFGRHPTTARHQLVLRGLDIETAIAVDDVIHADGTDRPPEVALDLAALRAHPAFQPGAATPAELES